MRSYCMGRHPCDDQIYNDATLVMLYHINILLRFISRNRAWDSGYAAALTCCTCGCRRGAAWLAVG